MKQSKVSKFEGKNIKVSFAHPTTRTSIDTARLKAKQPDIYKLFKN